MYKANIEDKMFSIIIPCYNSEKYLGRLLDCIEKQTYKRLEIILVDDGSTDRTMEIMESYKTILTKEGALVKIEHQNNKGLGGAINTGLKLVTGEFFGWVNSDEMLMPNYVEKYMDIFLKDSECNVIQRNGYMVPENEIDKIGKKEFRMINDWNINPYDEHLFMNMMLEVNYNFTYAAVRTEAFDKVVKDRNIYESREGQNWQLLLPMFYNYPSKYINEPGVYFIERTDSLSRNYKKSDPSRLYRMYDEYKKILLTTLKSMNIENYNYYEKLINQKYIVKKLEYAKSIRDVEAISYYEEAYKKDVADDNIYEKEIAKVRAKKPLVSIIIPVYNGSNYLREAIESAINQDYENIEIIVVNDGSNDNGMTEKIALEYSDKITYYAKENGGVSTALNYGISKMKGAFFSWLSHDDRYYSNKISTQVNYLIDNNLLNKKVITYTNYDTIDENGNVNNQTMFEVFNPNQTMELALLRGLISGTALLIPKTAFEEYGCFDVKYRCIQDYLLFFNFMETYKYIHIPVVTNSTRIHSGQVTHSNPKVIEENNYLWTLMQEKTDERTKIKISGSVYEFYIDTEAFLREIAKESGNDYVKAREYSLTMANEYLENGKKSMSRLIAKYDSGLVFEVIKNEYNKSGEYANIYAKKTKYKIQLDEIKKDINGIIEKIGLYNTINIVYNDKSSSKYRLMYYRMINNISKKNIFYNGIQLSRFQRLMLYIKYYGIFRTCAHTVRKFFEKLKYSSL